MHSAIRDQNQQQPKPTNNKKKKRIRKKGKKNKENHNQIRILYANVNGARGKITSLQAAADSQKSHIVAIAETKGNPPALEGYAPWYHKPRPDRNGGGVAITVRNDLKCNTQIVDDLEDNNQEIIWIQISINKKKENIRRSILWETRKRPKGRSGQGNVPTPDPNNQTIEERTHNPYRGLQRQNNHKQNKHNTNGQQKWPPPGRSTRWPTTICNNNQV